MTTTPGTSNIVTNLLNSLPLGVVTETGKVRLDSPSSLLEKFSTVSPYSLQKPHDFFIFPAISSVSPRDPPLSSGEGRAVTEKYWGQTQVPIAKEKDIVKTKTAKNRSTLIQYDLSFMNVTINCPINNTSINTSINTGIYSGPPRAREAKRARGWSPKA